MQPSSCILVHGAPASKKKAPYQTDSPEITLPFTCISERPPQLTDQGHRHGVPRRIGPILLILSQHSSARTPRRANPPHSIRQKSFYRDPNPSVLRPWFGRFPSATTPDTLPLNTLLPSFSHRSVGRTLHLARLIFHLHSSPSFGRNITIEQWANHRRSGVKSVKEHAAAGNVSNKLLIHLLKIH